MRKILCVVALALMVPIGAMAGTALAHTSYVPSSGVESMFQAENGGFGIICAKALTDISHGGSGWTGGGTTHGVWGTFCPSSQSADFPENDLAVDVMVRRIDGFLCNEFAFDKNPNIFGSYAWAGAVNNFCGAPASGIKRVETVHVSRIYGIVDSEERFSDWHTI